jgi:hypothetical protein
MIRIKNIGKKFNACCRSKNTIAKRFLNQTQFVLWRLYHGKKSIGKTAKKRFQFPDAPTVKKARLYREKNHKTIRNSNPMGPIWMRLPAFEPSSTRRMGTRGFKLKSQGHIDDFGFFFFFFLFFFSFFRSRSWTVRKKRARAALPLSKAACACAAAFL